MDFVSPLKAVIFDWGNTLMTDFGLEGPMCDWPRVEAVSGACETLKALFGHFSLIVATNGESSGASEVRRALERVGMNRFFQAVFAQKDLGVGKPDKAFFAAICEAKGLRPDECLMVGDHAEKDVKGASDFGMRALLYDPEDSYPDFRGEKIRDLRELLKLI